MISYLVFDVGGVLVSRHKLNQEIIGLCYQLKENGLNMGVLSNYSYNFIDRYLLDPELFSPVVYAGNSSFLKPDSRAYEYFCRQADCLPEECLLIDDNYVNVLAAEDFGMTAVLFTGLTDLIEQLQLQGLI